MNKVWKLAPRKFDNLIDQLLFNRGIIDGFEDEEKKFKYFHPNFHDDLYDPYLMTDMRGAIKRIQKAIENNEKIGIFSDYDADGIPGAALLFRAFNKLGIGAEVYIPNREGGYGLSREGIDHLVERECKLIITIDLGIRNLTEPSYCRDKGVDLIITDHHLPGEEIPDANFVINPKRSDDKYPYKELCGCGVAYKLIQALSLLYPKQLDEKFLKWCLDLVAISTISDVVPLSGENRTLVKYGLMVLKKTKNIGLIELYKKANILPETIGAYAVGFQIGPRINAPGRIDNATKSFELLVTENINEAAILAEWLNVKNEERQADMDEIENEATKIIEDNKLFDNKIIIASGMWTKGVIGPTASRLVEKYGRPVILFSIGEESYTGSARSVSGVNIVELLECTKDLILKYGGHKGAAGLAVGVNQFAEFTKKIVEVADSNISESDLTKKISIDAEVRLSEMTFKLYNEIVNFEPFGMGNSKPVFMAHDISFESFRFVGKNSNHFSAISNEKEVKIKSIYFNFPFEKSIIKCENRYDIVFTLNQDEWNGNIKLSLNIIDLKEK
ncbi:MAG: single-stranded-DNA-specific exonuclease RecJ [bacterium]